MGIPMPRLEKLHRHGEIQIEYSYPFNNHPVDNCNPSDKRMKSYPELVGCRLTSANIGEIFVRVFPWHNIRINCYDWSHIPEGKELQNIQKVALKFLGFKNDSGDLMFERVHQDASFSKELSYSPMRNDGGWGKVEDLIKHLESKV